MVQPLLLKLLAVHTLPEEAAASDIDTSLFSMLPHGTPGAVAGTWRQSMYSSLPSDSKLPVLELDSASSGGRALLPSGSCCAAAS